MGRKFEVTGKAVIFTEDGAKIIDAEVRRLFNAHCDSCDFKLRDVPENYLLIGGARTVPADNIYAKPAFKPERVQHAFKYASTKFFRLTIDLMCLAQWQPIHRHNVIMNYHWFRYNYFSRHDMPPDIDFNRSVAEIDAQLYRKYEFTSAMIAFTEARYRYDVLQNTIQEPS